MLSAAFISIQYVVVHAGVIWYASQVHGATLPVGELSWNDQIYRKDRRPHRCNPPFWLYAFLGFPLGPLFFDVVMYAR